MTGIDGMLPQLAAPAAPDGRFGAKLSDATGAKLRETAREFEATLLATLLKEMRQTLEPDGLFPGDSGDVQGGLFDLYLSRHLADGGGVGLAAAVVQQTRPATTPSTPDATTRPAPGHSSLARPAGR